VVWISLFTIATAAAIGLSIAALFVQTDHESAHG
jgi:hypothetical protein